MTETRLLAVLLVIIIALAAYILARCIDGRIKG